MDRTKNFNNSELPEAAYANAEDLLAQIKADKISFIMMCLEEGAKGSSFNSVGRGSSFQMLKLAFHLLETINSQEDGGCDEINIILHLLGIIINEAEEARERVIAGLDERDGKETLQ